MTLLSLLLVLALERVSMQSPVWQIETYYTRIKHYAPGFSDAAGGWVQLMWLLLPCLLVYWLLNWLNSGLISLLVNTVLLMVCIGCSSLRAIYKCFLQAADRGDLQACSLYADQLGHKPQGIGSFGQNLVWLNYRHYIAVMVFFIALGAPGALFYTLVRVSDDALSGSEHHTPLRNVMGVLDWLPVRISAFGLLMVGHFSRALPVWLKHFFNLNMDAKQLLGEVAQAAEDAEPCEKEVAREPQVLVRLAKRNVMLIAAGVSILTLAGWLN